MAGIRTNRHYNDPSIGAAFSSLASAFGPPDSADFANYATAAATREKASRLAQLFAEAKDFDQRNIAAGNYNPTQSYYAQDQNTATTQRGQDLTFRASRLNNADDNVRAIATNKADNQRAFAATRYGPLSEGQVLPELPDMVATIFGLPAGQAARGAVKLNEGQVADMPGVGVLQGRDKPLTMPEWEAAQAEAARKSGRLTDDMIIAKVMGSTPTMTTVGPDNKPRVRFATAAAAEGATPAPDASKAADISSGIRKEIVALPSYKNFSQAAPIYQSMMETAGRNSKASDLNMVYGLGKIMDPGSVVREGEMVMVKNTASLPDWLQGAIAQLNGGAALTPATREAIMREAYSRMKSYSNLFESDIGRFGEIADRSGINRADVLPTLPELKPFSAPETPAGALNPGVAGGTGDQPARVQTQAEYEALPSGATFIAPDGSTRRKP